MTVAAAPADVTVVWVAPSEGRDAATRALASWARARGVRLSAPQEAPSRPSLRAEPALATAVEKELERAREAISALDMDAAERSLARAEASLHDHPEMPEAAWLLAEAKRAWSARWLRATPRDEERARTAWQEADALDGGRAAGVGEIAFGGAAARAFTLNVSGANADVVVKVDGLAVPSGVPSADGKSRAFTVTRAPGVHAVVASAFGEPLFASWIALEAPAPVTFALPEAAACSPAAFERVNAAGGQPVAPGVSCTDWLVAAPVPTLASGGDAVRVARCHDERCGPFLEWRVESPRDDGLGRPPSAGWPGWATWALVGFGAATATTMALVATGVFEARPVEPRFVGGGVRVE